MVRTAWLWPKSLKELWHDSPDDWDFSHNPSYSNNDRDHNKRCAEAINNRISIDKRKAGKEAEQNKLHQINRERITADPLYESLNIPVHDCISYVFQQNKYADNSSSVVGMEVLLDIILSHSFAAYYLGLNLTTIFSLRYKIHNCNNLLLI